MRTRGEDGLPHGQDRGLRRNQPWDTWIWDFQPPGLGTINMLFKLLGLQ